MYANGKQIHACNVRFHAEFIRFSLMKLIEKSYLAAHLKDADFHHFKHLIEYAMAIKYFFCSAETLCTLHSE